MKKLLIATRSKGKLGEIQDILGDLPVKLLLLDDIKKIPRDFDVEETGKSLKENAILKAKTFGKMSGILTLADDSGLFVDALPDKLGILTKRYAKGSDKNRYEELLRELKGLPVEKRKAKFACVVCLYSPQSDKLIIRQGECLGFIAEKPKGKHGFGFDPVFIVEKLGKHFAELTRTKKNQVSHRARAVGKIRGEITQHLKIQQQVST